MKTRKGRPPEIGEWNGHLFVVDILRYDKHGNRRVVAWCRCGQYWTGPIARIRSGHTISCGCLAGEKTRIGQKYGRLTITRVKRNGRAEALCECGKKWEGVPGAIRSGAIKSCGCYCLKPDAVVNDLLDGYRRGALKRGHAWRLSRKAFIALATSPSCFHCGSTEGSQHRAGRFAGRAVLFGVDRLNNNAGYSKENCVPCCKACNIAKFTMSVEAFDAWVRRAYLHKFGQPVAA